MSNEMKSASMELGGSSSWYRRDNDVKIEFGFGVPLGAMSAHPVFHSAWDIGWYAFIKIILGLDGLCHYQLLRAKLSSGHAEELQVNMKMLSIRWMPPFRKRTQVYC